MAEGRLERPGSSFQGGCNPTLPPTTTATARLTVCACRCLAPPCTPSQDTMAEMASDIKAKRTGEVSASADELFQFINKVRGWRGFLGSGRGGDISACADELSQFI